MAIILNETEWAKQMVDTSNLGKKPSETLNIVARYYLDLGYSKNDTRNKLDDFLIKCDPDASIVKWDAKMDRAVNYAANHEAINIAHIDVSTTEMQKVNDLQGVQTRRLGFTLLCLAKYCDNTKGNSDHWVTQKDSDIMALANINTSIKRQSAMYRALRDAGMIQFSTKVDNTNVKVLFIDNGAPVMQITDMRNLGYQYLMYLGEPYFECENCGIVTKMYDPGNKRRQKYCQECAAKMKIQKTVDSIMRHRSKAVEC